MKPTAKAATIATFRGEPVQVEQAGRCVSIREALSSAIKEIK